QSFAVRKSQLFSFARGILMNRDQRRSTAAFSKHFSDAVSRSFRSNHADINIFGRIDCAKADVETMSEHQSLPFCKVWFDVLLVNISLRVVWNQNHDYVRPLRSISDAFDFEPRSFGLSLRSAASMKADADIHSAVFQVKSMSVAL